MDKESGALRCNVLNIEKLVLRVRAEFNGFAGKDCELFWSTGALEHWSIGLLAKAKARIST